MIYWLGAIGSTLFVLVFLADGWTRPGYSPVRHPVSALALGPRGWIQTSNFLVCGAAITIGALGVTFAGQSYLLGPMLAVFGLGLVASGVFPMDPMRGYPPGTPDGDPAAHTSRHKLHDYAGMVVFLALPAAAAIGAFVMPGVTWKSISAFMAIGLMIGFGTFGTAWENDSPKVGLFQRAVIIPGWFWVTAVFLDFAYR
ncbi:DUF998 domain-containing protein [Phytoactinopolyspora mesophila]|uniref:DUF998 domain-containing protein n=1 Tax=Phytoactinopolyspora mesophila TaxID=2650750 RepID=A0A7K3M8B9_9ACTN|nr:DUF998 domain-containing protein [Phytoactinopolyspora mesophila]NDL59591.1 DUF998 domain-containing protein [Phytoactinopolyspora mesophila]